MLFRIFFFSSVFSLIDNFFFKDLLIILTLAAILLHKSEKKQKNFVLIDKQLCQTPFSNKFCGPFEQSQKLEFEAKFVREESVKHSNNMTYDDYVKVYKTINNRAIETNYNKVRDFRKLLRDEDSITAKVSNKEYYD